jgi:hypothetical protein
VDRLRSMAAEVTQPLASCSSTAVEEMGGGGAQSALEEELLGGDVGLAPEQVIRRLLQICEQLERERDEAEEALKRGKTVASNTVK